MFQYKLITDLHMVRSSSHFVCDSGHTVIYNILYILYPKKYQNIPRNFEMSLADLRDTSYKGEHKYKKLVYAH